MPPTPFPSPRYSAAELASCQVLNDLTAATLRLGLLERSGLRPAQLVHVRALARCLAATVATIAAAHVDAVVVDIPAPRPGTHLRPQLLDVRSPDRDYGGHHAE